MVFSFTDVFVTNMLSNVFGALSVSCVSDDVKEIISEQLRDIDSILSCSCGDDDE